MSEKHHTVAGLSAWTLNGCIGPHKVDRKGVEFRVDAPEEGVALLDDREVADFGFDAKLGCWTIKRRSDGQVVYAHGIRGLQAVVADAGGMES